MCQINKIETQKPLEIIELPSNLGLIAPAPGKEPGVKRLPGWLKQHGFYDIIAPRQVHSLIPPSYSTVIDKESGVRNANAIAAYAMQQAKFLTPLIASGIFPLVIGGDCSILIGNALALKQNGHYALFFLDGHTDYIWPELSQTHGAAGMDLAIVTGTGHSKLTNINQLIPYIKEENVWAVGNREFDEKYFQTIIHSNINYYDLNKLRNEGIKNCADDFSDMLLKKQSDGFWIHLDVDVLNDNIMPAVDSREGDGLSYTELTTVLNDLLSNPLCAGMEITILDPDLDPDGIYTKEFVRQIGSALVSAK